MKVICQICQSVIAEFEPAEISFPLVGRMFKSPEPERGVPDPFPSYEPWEYFFCPMCRHKPMVRPDQILTPQGILNVPSNGGKTFFTPGGQEIDRTSVFDRELQAPPTMTDEQAEALVRSQMGQTTTKAEVEDNGKADTRQGESEDQEPVKGKTEETKVSGAVDGKRETGKAGTGGLFNCPECEGIFRSRAGLSNHRRVKHKK